jgi:hypothetical protein
MNFTLRTHRANYAGILLKWGLVLSLILLASEAVSHIYQKTPQYEQLAKETNFILFRTRVLFGHRPTYQEYYGLIADRLIQNQQYYARTVEQNFQFAGGTQEHKISPCGDRCISSIWQSTNSNVDRWKRWRNEEWAKWFYALGIENSKDGNVYGAVAMLEFSRSLAPEWSYFHIELANVLFQDGQIDQGRKVLNECLLFVAARSHCQTMIDEQMWEDIVAPGFLSEIIENNVPHRG